MSARDADDIVLRLNRFIDSLHVGHAALAHARARRTELQHVADSLWDLVDAYQRTGPLAVNSSWREILDMYRDGVVIVKSDRHPTPWGIRWAEIRGNADGTFSSSLVIEDANGAAMFDMSAIGQQHDELWQLARCIVNTMNNKEES